MNTINTQRKCRKINETNLYPPAHNGLVAGSSPAGPTTLLVRQRSQPFVVIRSNDIFPNFPTVYGV